MTTFIYIIGLIETIFKDDKKSEKMNFVPCPLSANLHTTL